MNTLLWHLRQATRPLGLSGWIGLALGGLALLLHLVGTQPLTERNAATGQRIEALRLAAATPATPEPLAEPAPLMNLPPAGAVDEEIGTLARLAQAHGIALPRGQYSATALTGTPLQRWQLTLPVEAEYPALMTWLAAALERLPGLTLDEMKLKRERIESPVLQAQLRLSVYGEKKP